ncbi:MAG: type I-C CRISPR-associated protein Cas5 [Armatimonadetes bacterium]|nr:type I-C CRISPR-associated protein Cas5 [Armatimonadota bacterium]
MEPKDQVLEVWGEFACFTQLKVERFSYPVITPSAARGIFDAIYCKPSRDGRSSQFRWEVTMVEVLREPRYTGLHWRPSDHRGWVPTGEPVYIPLRRNEVKDQVDIKAVLRWMHGKAPLEPIWADAMDADKGRTQRQTMALKNVHYRLHARVRPWPGHEGQVQRLEAQFRRRASHGKCFHQPYFGCREFPAFFELVEPGAPPAERARWTQDLGWMVYDVYDLSSPGTDCSEPKISLFHAAVDDGLMAVPAYESAEVRRAEGGGLPCSGD